MTLFASVRRDESGSAAVEFALVAPPLLTMIVGVLMLGMAYFEGASVQWAMERSLRAAMVHPDLSATEIEAMLMEDLQEAGSPEIDFNYEIDETGAVPLAVATASYDVALNIPFVPDLSLHFAAENVGPVPQE
jgi:Flp pilus assembly pilin Flp